MFNFSVILVYDLGFSIEHGALWKHLCLLTSAFRITEANLYFVEFISKAYQALTDPVSRENYEKYGHPDGRQVDILLIK